MNAITPIGATAGRGRFGTVRDEPIPGDTSIPVTIDGTCVLVFHEQGRPTWCHILLADGVLLPGMRAAEVMKGSLFGAAVRHADALLAGLRQAGEYPAEPAMPGWRFALLCAGFAILAFAVIWAVVAAGFWMERQQ